MILDTLKAVAVSGVLFGAGVIIDEKTAFQYGTVTAMVGCAIYIGRKLQQIDDNFKAGEERMERIENTLARLPCPSKIHATRENCKSREML